MQIKLTRNSETNVTATIVVDQSTLDKIKLSTLKQLNSPTLKVQGFRAGKAPLEMVEKQLDPDALQAEFIDNVLNFAFGQVVSKEKLRTIGQPAVNLKKFVPFTTFECEITTDVLGEVVLPDYKKVKKQRTMVNIEAKEVNEVVKSLQTRLADKQSVDRAAKLGDEVIFDFAGTDEKGQSVNGADGKDYPLLLGSNSFIPGFEPKMVGLKPGDSRVFTVPFPADYQVKALQSKKVTFSVTVKSVQELVEPKADDGFAAKAGPFTTLKDLKADIKKQLTLEKQKEQDRLFENELLETLVSKAKIALPEAIIDEQVQRLEEEERQNLTYRGETWQEHLEREGVTDEEHRKRNRPAAAMQIRIGVMLGAIGDEEGIDVTPEELEIRLQLLKGQYSDPTMQEELNKPENQQDIMGRIRTEKIIQKLVGYAEKK